MSDIQLAGNYSTGTYSGDYIGYCAWTKFQAVASGQLDYFLVRMATSGNIKAAIYSHDADLDQPKNLLGQTAEKSAVGNAYNKLSIISPISLVSGQYYWLAVAFGSGQARGSSTGQLLAAAITYSEFSFPSSFDGSYDFSENRKLAVSAWNIVPVTYIPRSIGSGISGGIF